MWGEWCEWNDASLTYIYNISMKLKLTERIVVGFVGCLIIASGFFIFLVGLGYPLISGSFAKNIFLLAVFVKVIPFELKELHLLLPAFLFFCAVGIYYLVYCAKGLRLNNILRVSVLAFILFILMLPFTYFLGDYMCQITPPDGFCMLYGIPPLLLGFVFFALCPIIFIIGVVFDIIRYRRRVK